MRNGKWTGYPELRYGGSGRPITLANNNNNGRRPKKRKPIMRGEERETVVAGALDILLDWRSSPFEFEASVRHGLRSSLCLAGHSWVRADEEAAAIVVEALRRSGAARPNWEEGQREFVDVGSRCWICGGDLGDDATLLFRRTRYCSDRCARTALSRTSFSRKDGAGAQVAAYRLIKQAAMTEKACLHCQATFRPSPAKKGPRHNLYCSMACQYQARWINPEQPCAHCRTMFRRNGKGKRAPKFCSTECFRAGNSYVRRCVICDAAFVAKKPEAIYCSPAHRRIGTFAQRKLKESNIFVLTPAAFDREFALAA